MSASTIEPEFMHRQFATVAAQATAVPAVTGRQPAALVAILYWLTGVGPLIK